MTDFPRLLQALASNGVEFILVGGAAATAHGSVRLTLDVDIVYSRRDENLARLVAALAPHQPYLRGNPEADAGDPSRLRISAQLLDPAKRCIGPVGVATTLMTGLSQP